MCTAGFSNDVQQALADVLKYSHLSYALFRHILIYVPSYFLLVTYYSVKSIISFPTSFGQFSLHFLIELLRNGIEEQRYHSDKEDSGGNQI